MNFTTQRERKVSLKWITRAGKERSRGIWIRDIPAFIQRNSPAGAHDFQWKDFGKKEWKKIP